MKTVWRKLLEALATAALWLMAKLGIWKGPQ